MSETNSTANKKERPKPDFIDLAVFGASMFAGIYFSGGPIDSMTLAGLCFGIMGGWLGSKVYHSSKALKEEIGHA